MKLRYRLLTFVLLFGLFTFDAAPTFGQVGDIGDILQAGREDANTLARSYLEPFGSGFGASLNTGWTNTASPHSKLGFDVTVSAGLAIVPDAAKSFNINELGLQQLELEGTNPVTPTINGADETGSLLAAYEEINGTRQKLLEFNMPNGSGFGYVPAPMIKAGVGIIKDTELMLRYTPKTKIGDFGSFNLFGVGAKHGINQWLPGGKLLPVNLSVMFGYTTMDVGSDLNLTASDVIRDPNNTENPYNVSQWEDQTVEMNTDAWTINALVGKSLPIISVYAGVGYEASTFSITTPGSYPTVIPNEAYQNDPQNNEPLIVNAVDDPIDVSIDGDNGFRALAGFRLKFTVLHISGSYTLSNYPSYNLGVGISFR
ncbi:DUF6588 family protein [Fodinibius sp.]|uniref:DUF6588 family protein n=1 Tax=Fodinibius sp. TaxID=1872440 RepID=UPI002ACD9333|nr:DUF6588 family protein [Fodinibius sp.]MDZ7660588.1 DUF6588 family protein [Fodinibius sp.]